MLYSLGMTQEDICKAYYNTVSYIKSKDNKWSCPFFPERLRGIKPSFDIIDADSGEIIAPVDKKVTVIAIIIPKIPNKLPFLDVSGDDSPLKAKINNTPEIR